MSSTITQTEVKTLTVAAVTASKMEDKQSKLVRSYSIEKIKRFNTFICSQQYYFLPAIFSWLKSSQSGLQSSTEKTIFFFRSLFFRSLLYKYCIIGVKSCGLSTPKELLNILVKIKMASFKSCYKTLTKCPESSVLLAAAVYGACAIVLVQLLTTIYLLCITLVPYGFVFLICCMLTIKFICYKTLFFHLSNSTKCK